MVRKTIECMPLLELMPTMLRDHPHTNLDSGCALALAKMAGTSTPASKKRPTGSTPGAPESELEQRSTLLRDQLHYEASQELPIELSELLRMHGQLVCGTMRMDDQTALPSSADAFQHLRMRSRALPVFTAEHESRLLRQATTVSMELMTRVKWAPVGGGPAPAPTEEPTMERRTYTYPPCMMGQQCVGYAAHDMIAGLTERIVLMRAMTPEEWANLARTGEQPPGESPCVLCHRLSVEEYIYHRRFVLANRGSEDEAGNSTFECAGWEVRFEAPNEVAQLWRNRVDEPGGYFREYVTTPQARELIIDPLCSAPHHGVRAMLAGSTWVLDQSAMVWRAPVELEAFVGESVQDFSRGASSTTKSSAASGVSSAAAPEPATSTRAHSARACSAQSDSSLYADVRIGSEAETAMWEASPER